MFTAEWALYIDIAMNWVAEERIGIVCFWVQTQKVRMARQSSCQIMSVASYINSSQMNQSTSVPVKNYCYIAQTTYR